MSTFGFVYVLGNPSMPDIVKIGRTDRSPHQRAVELSAVTGVPKPFSVELYVEVENPMEVERLTHEHFALFRVSDKREFFFVTPVEAWRFLCDHAIAHWLSDPVGADYDHLVACEEADEIIARAAGAN
jgi:hypothetical protein